jgi:CRISPR-associated protein Cas5t
MLFVYFKAPFGAFKPFHSIELHTTADFLTHSAAYGFLLGLAGLDRHRKRDFIGAKIAIGQIGKSFRGRALQQLHKMPKQNQGYEVMERAKGNKPKIDVFRRDYLCRLEGFIGLDDERLETQVRKGIDEPTSINYWGLPFMGDNNFFVEKVEIFDCPNKKAKWFVKFDGQVVSTNNKLHYLSVWADTKPNPTTDTESNNSNYMLFFVSENMNKPPNEAWVDIEEKKS